MNNEWIDKYWFDLLDLEIWFEDIGIWREGILRYLSKIRNLDMSEYNDKGARLEVANEGNVRLWGRERKRGSEGEGKMILMSICRWCQVRALRGQVRVFVECNPKLLIQENFLTLWFLFLVILSSEVDGWMDGWMHACMHTENMQGKVETKPVADQRMDWYCQSWIVKKHVGFKRQGGKREGMFGKGGVFGTGEGRCCKWTSGLVDLFKVHG